MRSVVLSTLAAWSFAAFAQVGAVDSDGRTVKLPAPAARIVSLAPHATELLYAAGAGERIVGASDYSDYPEPARRLPRVASSGNIDLERLLALQPDLVVAWRLEATAKSLDRLAGLGIPVFYSEPHKLDEIPASLEALGVLAGTAAVAKAEAGRLRAELARLRAAYRDRPRLRVFYQISERPLMTINGRQFVSDALALCGAQNVFADAPIIAPMVSAEAVLAADPDAILAAQSDPADRAWQAAWRRFGELRAVRTGNLLSHGAEAMHRHGPRAIAATGRMCELLDEARGRIPHLKPKAASPR